MASISNFALLGLVPQWAMTWLTPIWILCVGVLFGLIGLLLLWGLIYALSIPVAGLRRFATEIPQGVREGVLWPLLMLFVCLGSFGIIGGLVSYYPGEILASLVRLPSVGQQQTPPLTIRAASANSADGIAPLETIPIKFRRDELSELEITATGDFTWSPVDDNSQYAALAKTDVRGGETFRWRRGIGTVDPFGVLTDDKTAEIAEIYVRNNGDRDAQLTVTAKTDIQHPEARGIPVVAIGVMVIFALYLVQRSLFPRMSAIALATTKSNVAQPLFILLLLIGITACFAFMWIPYNTFGEDIKTLKDSGLTLIMILGIILAVWAASNAVADEIEGRTALTVLSKPITRRQFILGKFIGINWSVLLLVVCVGAFFLLVVSYKPIYDARETAAEQPAWQVCYQEVAQVSPGLLLALMEAIVLGAISVAISTRLPLLANFVIVLSIYVVGNINSSLVASTALDFEIVRFIGQFVATIFPVLDVFNLNEAIATDAVVPWSYLGWALAYCILYCGMAILLALALFEDRDLA